MAEHMLSKKLQPKHTLALQIRQKRGILITSRLFYYVSVMSLSVGYCPRRMLINWNGIRYVPVNDERIGNMPSSAETVS